MREALGIDDNLDILGYIKSLPTREEQLVAHTKIEKVEEDAMNKMVSPRCTKLREDCSRRIRTTDESLLLNPEQSNRSS
jgi:hypothetical protein